LIQSGGAAGAEAVVETHRAIVPVEDDPFEAQGVSGEGFAGECGHEGFADSAAPGGFGDDEVLEVEEGAGAEAAEPFVEERDSFDRTIELRDEGLELFRIEDPGQEALGFFVVSRAEFFEPRQFPVERDDPRTVLPARATNDRL
jgi:hypothetical protein